MNADPFPTFRRFFRFILRCLRRLRRIFFSRRSAVVYLILGTLLALAWTIDRWHGRRAWAAEKERLAAAGESLDLRDLLPKRPPDEENFCAIPELNGLVSEQAELWGNEDRRRMWFAVTRIIDPTHDRRTRRIDAGFPPLTAGTPLSKWCEAFRRTGALPAVPLHEDPARELLLSAEQWRESLDRLYAASARPSAVFLPTMYERREKNPHFGFFGDTSLLIGLGRTLTLHGIASIEDRDVETAQRDARVLKRLAEACQNECTLIGFLIGGTVSRWRNEIFLAGILRHTWSEQDLLQFDSVSREEAVSSAFQAAMAVERAVLCHRLEDSHNWQAQWISTSGRMPWEKGAKMLYAKIAPEGPFLRYGAQLSQHYSLLAGEAKVPAPAELQNPWLNRMRSVEAPGLLGPRFNDNILELFVRVLIEARVFRTAYTLERHFLVHRRYPSALESVIAASPPNAFTDIDGKPFRYRAAPDGTSFKLWSVGRNGTDDTSDPNVPVRENDDWSVSTE